MLDIRRYLLPWECGVVHQDHIYQEDEARMSSVEFLRVNKDWSSLV